MEADDFEEMEPYEQAFDLFVVEEAEAVVDDEHAPLEFSEPISNYELVLVG